jgi:hypothetical protein
MPAFLDHPAVRARVSRMSVETYHRIYMSGVELGNVELIRGVIFDKEPKSPLHCWAIGLLCAHLDRRVPDNHYVRQSHPLTCTDSEPEPALAVVLGKPFDHSVAHPSTASLIVEIPIVSEAAARVKLEIYAEAAVQECWLVFPETETVERHTGLHDGAYRNIQRATFPATLESTVFAGIELPPSELFAA